MDYVLEVETKNRLVKIRGARKTRIKSTFLQWALQVMDGDGNWHTISKSTAIGGLQVGEILIMEAIEKKDKIVKINEVA